MSFGDHFRNRFRNILRYTSNNVFYVIIKTLCIIVGLPLYVALIPIDLLFFVVYALFSWIPFVGIFFLFITKGLSLLWGIGYYIAILPDCKRYLDIHLSNLEREMHEDEAQEVEIGVQTNEYTVTDAPTDEDEAQDTDKQAHKDTDKQAHKDTD